MQQVLNEVGQIAQRLAGVIWQVLQFIWNWSFGQVMKMFQMPFNTLPLWKQVLFVIVIAALAYFLYKVAKDLLKAVQSVLGAIVGLIPRSSPCYRRLYMPDLSPSAAHGSSQI